MYKRGDLRSVYIGNIYIVGLVYMFWLEVAFEVMREMYTLICVCYVWASVSVMCWL